MRAFWVCILWRRLSGIVAMPRRVKRCHCQPHPAPGEAVCIAEGVKQRILAEDAVLARRALIQRQARLDRIAQRQIFAVVKRIRLLSKPGKSDNYS